MKRVGVLAVTGLVAFGSALFGNIETASAIKPFENEFKTKYVKEGSAEPAEKALAEAVAAAKCNVCHMGTSKKNRNVYGEALAELLDKATDKEDTAKIQKALDTVAALKSNGDPNGPTFGDLIKAGKLPAEE